MTDLPFENLSDCVFYHATRTPDAPALIDRRETLSYAQLADLVRRAAVYLGALGLKPGERVGIGNSHSIDRMIITLGAMRFGVTPIDLPAALSAETLAVLARRFEMAATFTDPLIAHSPARHHVRMGLGWRAGLAVHEGDARFEGDHRDLTLIILSSGSTGLPKGFVTTQAQRVARTLEHMNKAGFWLAGGKPGMLLLPAAPSTGIISQFFAVQLILGGPSVIIPEFAYLQELVRDVVQWEDAIFPVPPGLARAIEGCAEPGTLLLPNLRAIVLGGQPVSVQDKVSLRAALTPHLFELYASVGIGIIARIGPDESEHKPGSVGKPFAGAGVEVQLIGPDGAPVPAGQMGEVRMRGDNLSRGFYPVAEDRGRVQAERFEGGWYYPGELARYDEDGYLFLVGRSDDAMRVGGHTIYPGEVEDVMRAHPDIADIAVVIRPGPTGTEELVAFVVARPGYKHPSIATFARKQLPPERRPKFFYYITQLPRNAGGKVDRPTLRTAKVNVTQQTG
jgi:acyl-CoA synthetase (AMP-forming)/AMP-acid ligase II